MCTLMLMCVLGAAPASATAQATHGWTSIFDGKSLAGWSGESFAVNDGTLGGRAAQGQLLCTERMYGDFVLRLRSRVPSTSNARVLVRVPMTSNGVSLGTPVAFSASRTTSPASGPSAIATAIALLSSTYGDGAIRASPP